LSAKGRRGTFPFAGRPAGKDTIAERERREFGKRSLQKKKEGGGKDFSSQLTRIYLRGEEGEGRGKAGKKDLF